MAKFGDREQLGKFTKGLLAMPFVERANTHVVLTTVSRTSGAPLTGSSLGSIGTNLATTWHAMRILMRQVYRPSAKILFVLEEFRSIVVQC